MTPIRRKDFDTEGFIAFMASEGAEIGIPTNAYEVVRYRAFWQGSKRAVTHIVYAKENGQLTYMAGARDHYTAFLGEAAPDRVKRPKNTAPIRAKLIKRDGDCCWYCGGLLASAESNVEHLISISDGGNNSLANLVLTHTSCNTKAGNKSLAAKLELRGALRREKAQ